MKKVSKKMVGDFLTETKGETKLYQNKYPIPATAKYVIDYVYDNAPGEPNFYYQIVRIKDDAILYANADRNNVIMECWKRGIPYNETTFI